MRDSIERFLVQKSFKPLTKRTSVLVEYIYLVLNRNENINTSPIKEVSNKFDLAENNVIQLLYQSKKYFQTNLTPKELAYKLAQEFIEWRKHNE
jgi:cyanate lyase